MLRLNEPKANELPPLDSAACEHQKKVFAYLKQQMDIKNGLSFADYMHAVLYTPGLGYYMAGATKFGEAGDFVTAPEISDLFGQCLAQQIAQILKKVKNGALLEFGAGSGELAITLMQALEKLDCLPSNYYIIEISAELALRQKKRIQSTLPALFNRFVWLDQLPKNPIQGVILANEVLDAMPVEKFKIDQGLIQTFYVNYANEALKWELREASAALKRAIKSLSIQFENGYESEINLFLPGWIASLENVLAQGAILLIDYGFPQSEYYHPQRKMGTLMCHYRQKAHTDPLILPGLQDITAHVNFTAIETAAEQCGLSISGFTNQANFLINTGLIDLLSQIPESKRLAVSQQVKQLVMPGEMGELFKVMALTKHCDTPLIGFN